MWLPHSSSYWLSDLWGPLVPEPMMATTPDVTLISNFSLYKGCLFTATGASCPPTNMCSKNSYKLMLTSPSCLPSVVFEQSGKQRQDSH